MRLVVASLLLILNARTASATESCERSLDPAWWALVVTVGDAPKIRDLRLRNGGLWPVGPYVGAGDYGVVYRLGEDRVVKIARPGGDPALFLAEGRHAEALDRMGFDVARVHESVEGAVPYLIKDYVAGPSLSAVRATGFSREQIAALAFLNVYCRGVKADLDLFDSRLGNLVWSSGLGRWVLVDTGVDLSPAFFRPFGVEFETTRGPTNTFELYLKDIFDGRIEDAEFFRATARRFEKILSAPTE